MKHKKKIATLILNRNLPKLTNRLYKYIQKYNSDYTDIFVIESGSDKNKLSKHWTWRADSKFAIKNGLRFSRGMNFGLGNLWKEGKFDRYYGFFLVTNDTEIKTKYFAKKIINIFEKHPRLGILSPCSDKTLERKFLKKDNIKYSWYIQNSAYAFRKEFIKDLINVKKPDYKNFLFDGSNYRGWGAISELIAKAYLNDWAAAFSNQIYTNENEKYLLKQHKTIKTDSYEKNLKLIEKETDEWMKKKFGFYSKWSMQMYVKAFYDKFFNYYPEYVKFRL